MYCSLWVSCLYVYDMDVVRGHPGSKESGGTIMDSWCMVSLARKRLGAQLWAVTCMVSLTRKSPGAQDGHICVRICAYKLWYG